MSKKKNKKKSKNVKETYMPMYTKESYNKDENSFNNSLKNGNINYNSFKRLMINDLCSNSKIIETGCIAGIDLDKIQDALKYPKHNWKTILAASDELMRISPHYFRLNSYYSNMALFNWGIDLYDVKDNANINSIKKIYKTLVSKLENMNIKHEFNKIMKVLPYQDIYCGLIFENNLDFFIQQVDYRICKLYQIQDGLYNFKINLSMINPKNLKAYPDYVQKAYDDFINGINGKWYVPPPDLQICIKLNYQWQYPYPLLIGLVKDILDLDVYKKLKLQSARTDNYKAIMVKVPIDESTIDKPLLTPETLGVFAEINRDSMTDDIGLLYILGSSGEAVSFKDSSNTRNNVSDAIDEIYNSSGESKELYNGSSSATAVSFSIENDSGFIYSLYRQFERWVNRYIKLRKYNKSTFKFYFYLLDMTIFNKKEVSNKYKDAISLGSTVIDKYMASLDMTPSRILGSYIIHNDIFDFVNKFIPLKTSYNSSENEVGRPTNESNGELLDETGEKTKDNDSNKDK